MRVKTFPQVQDIRSFCRRFPLSGCRRAIAQPCELEPCAYPEARAFVPFVLL